MIGIVGLATSLAAQEHVATRAGAEPMDALAEAILVIAPEAGTSGTPTLASLRAKPSPIQWKDASKRADESVRAVGMLAGGTVKAAKTATISELSFNWDGPEGQPFGFNPIKAFRKKGFEVQALYCASMVSEGTNYFLVTAPGKRPGFLSVYAFDAPLAISLASWLISYRLDGQVPSLAAVHASGDTEASTDCAAQVYGPVKQISHAAAMALVRTRASGSATQPHR